MPIEWTSAQKHKVGRILRECPALSGKCELAAKRILPLARERDSAAKARRLVPVPGRGFFVNPRVSLGGARWFHHVAVNAERHYVDALTGVDGTEEERYLEEHWKYPEALMWREEEAK